MSTPKPKDPALRMPHDSSAATVRMARAQRVPRPAGAAESRPQRTPAGAVDPTRPLSEQRFPDGDCMRCGFNPCACLKMLRQARREGLGA